MKLTLHAVAIATAISGLSMSAEAQTKRALVIGIDKYEQPAAQLAAWRVAVAPAIAAWRTRVGALALAPTSGGTTADLDKRATVPSLDGSVNDAMSMAAIL